MKKYIWLVDPKMKDCNFSRCHSKPARLSFSKHRWRYFKWNLRDFCPSINSLHNYHFDASKSSSRDHKTNPNESNGLVLIFWRDSIALYNEQTEHIYIYFFYILHLNIDQRTETFD